MITQTKMVCYHLGLHKLKKAEQLVHDEDSPTLNSVPRMFAYYKRRRHEFFALLFISLVSCNFLLTPHLDLFGSPLTSLFCFFHVEDETTQPEMKVEDKRTLPAEYVSGSVIPGNILCDRSAFRTDICFMKGGVRTDSATSSIFLYVPGNNSDSMNPVTDHSDNIKEEHMEIQREKIKPYTRKWETSVMDTIQELNLVALKGKPDNHLKCDVWHDVPAVFFSTGGYTGNVYHEFNDGTIPLYITSQHLKRKVIFVILEYHKWWISKYSDILSHLSDYPAIDFSGDKRIHCFPEAIVGLKIHDELTVDPSMMNDNKSIIDFRELLDRSYSHRVRGLVRKPRRSKQQQQKLAKVEEDHFKKPKLIILSRMGSSRVITNEKSLVTMAEEVGFEVEVQRPKKTIELAKIYRKLNESDVMIGVHGAALTHLLFLRPGSAFIQVIPLGTAWPAETYYAEPARKLGLKYVGYAILPRESSLHDKYPRDDPVLQNPESITKKGWQYTKAIFLEGQNVTLDLSRFQEHLVGVYKYSISRRTSLFKDNELQ